MRGALLLSFACVALVASACGGKSFSGDLGDGGDDGGSSSGSGSGSGSSSSGSGGSSSSGSGSSSGGGSGSSSGGLVCPPTAGEGTCSAGEQCNYGSGCGATFCSCGSGNQWVCAVSDCPPPQCPPYPENDLGCEAPGQTCGYPTGGGCGETCTCEPYGDAGHAWSCIADPCPPPTCPPAPPQNGDSCMPVNTSCDYIPDSGCGGVYCNCEAPGSWSCVVGDCVDAAPPPVDAGTWGD